MPSPMAGYILEVYLSPLEAEKIKKNVTELTKTDNKAQGIKCDWLSCVQCVCVFDILKGNKYSSVGLKKSMSYEPSNIRT